MTIRFQLPRKIMYQFLTLTLVIGCGVGWWIWWKLAQSFDSWELGLRALRGE